MTLPEVHDFGEAVEFLDRWIEARKGRGPFTLAAFARRAGFNSPSLLTMILRRKRRLTLDRISGLSRAMGLSAVEGQYFEYIARSSPGAANALEARVIRERKSFAPVHYEVIRDRVRYTTDVPSRLATALDGREYVIQGDSKSWNHRFFRDGGSGKLRCFRSHGHPSRFSAAICHYPKEVIFQKHPYLFIFWEEPVAQVHSIPLTGDFLAGKETTISDSGIVCRAFLKGKPVEQPSHP